MTTEHTTPEGQDEDHAAMAAVESAAWGVAALGRDPEHVAQLAREATRVGRQRLSVMSDALRRNRESKVAQHGRPTQASDVALEVNAFTDYRDSLIAIADFAKALADEAAAYAADAAAEAAVDGRPVRVGDPYGTDVRVSWVKRVTTSVDAAKLRETLVADVAARADRSDDVDYRDAIDKGIAAVLDHGRVSWSVTALDGLQRQMEAEDTDDGYARAIDLGHSYGRVETGEAKPKIDRVNPKGTNK